MKNNNEQLGKSIEMAFSKEPVAIGTAVSMAVTATLTALSALGYVGGETMTVVTALITAWLPVIGYAIRSNYTPYANQFRDPFEIHNTYLPGEGGSLWRDSNGKN